MSHSTAQIFHLMFVGWWETNLPLNSSPLVIHTQIRRRSHCLCSGFKDYGYNINKEKSWYLHWTMYSISPIFPLLHYWAILGEGKWGKKKKGMYITRCTQPWSSVARGVAMGKEHGEQATPETPSAESVLWKGKAGSKIHLLGILNCLDSGNHQHWSSSNEAEGRVHRQAGKRAHK